MKPLHDKSEWVKQLCDALEIPMEKTRHIIIDINVGSIVVVYTEQIADEQRFAVVSPTEMVAGAEIQKA